MVGQLIHAVVRREIFCHANGRVQNGVQLLRTVLQEFFPRFGFTAVIGSTKADRLKGEEGEQDQFDQDDQ